MKIAITGASGQLGTDLRKSLPDSQVFPLTHADIEITDIESVRRAIVRIQPDVIINTAAFVRVDDCETDRDRAFKVNALGVRNVAVTAQELGAKLVHLSTDYVFGGFPPANPASGYTEFDKPAPINVYGQSKLAGEEMVRHLCCKHFIVRSSSLFGTAGSSGKGGNFVETIIRLGKERPELRVVDDQISSPTFTRDLAEKIAGIVSTSYYGIFHITNSGFCSWHQFASEIIKLAGLNTPVIPISSDQYPQKARRPRFSVLDNYQIRLTGMAGLRSWQEALREYMGERIGHI
jgi:dTDP-4-dehydrorhamnose reductase